MRIMFLIKSFVCVNFVLGHTNQANYTKIPDDGKCRVLAMRGGGTKGAYEAGALKAMSDVLDPIDIAYDVLAGVSIGAVNAAYISTYERGDEALGIQKLVNLWETNGITDLWSNWPVFGWFAMLWQPSLVDNTKLYDMLHTKMEGRSFQKMLNIISVDLNTGDVIVFDETTPIEKQTAAMLASASIPGIFPP
jgi:predicted acylesterase/phospholipase RssA